MTRLKRLASFSNPVFFKTQALRFSTHAIPRYISCARVESNYLCLPRGCIDDTRALLTEQKIQIKTEDKRNRGTKLSNLNFLGNLREDQQLAINNIIRHDVGVLHAPTAFGKTVTAIGIKGTLAQYAGRIHRQLEGKEEVIIYDYVDAALPMLQRMFSRRSKGYKAMGYEIIYESASSDQPDIEMAFK